MAQAGPQQIGEYIVVDELGAGASGVVYDARERMTQRRVALKVLRGELSSDERSRRLFQREMGIVSSLHHPNLVGCLACFESEGRLVMALEHVDGATLRTQIERRGAHPPAEAIAIARQIAAGLAAAHDYESGIVHRDLKPENVMVSSAGVVKVTDFGIAKLQSGSQHTTTHGAGTLQYMSPEQIDAAEIGPRSDLYALGLILYELLCGRRPFDSESTRELLNLQCTAPPPDLPAEVRAALPEGAEAVMLSLLAKSPDDRPASAQVVERIFAQMSSAKVLGPEAGAERSGSAALPSAERAPTVASGASATGPGVTGSTARAETLPESRTGSATGSGIGSARPAKALETVFLLKSMDGSPEGVSPGKAVAAAVLFVAVAAAGTWGIVIYVFGSGAT